MTPSGADARIQQLAHSIYESPLAGVRDCSDYPNLENPLHVTILLLDADTEITMQGMLGFLENSTGRHLGATREALMRVGAHRSADLFVAIEACMVRHAVTWERLRGDFEGAKEYEVTSFAKIHPDLEGFADELQHLAAGFALFNTHGSLEDAYAFLCEYIERDLPRFDQSLAQALSA